LVNPKNAHYFLKPRFDQLYNDMSTEVEKTAKIQKGFIITPKRECPGAECGSIFMEFRAKEESEAILENFKGKNYENEKISVVCVPEEAYVNYYVKKFEAN